VRMLLTSTTASWKPSQTRLIPMPPGTFHLSQWILPRSLLVTDPLVVGTTGLRCRAFIEGGRIAVRGATVWAEVVYM
jgi:hypothetical protein